MGFEQLRVYQAAQHLDREVRRLVRLVPRGNADDIKQLLRSMGSLLFNLAEVWGTDSPGKKRHHLEITRGETEEVRGVLRRLVDKGCLTERQIRRACELTSVIAKMLTSWVHRLDNK